MKLTFGINHVEINKRYTRAALEEASYVHYIDVCYDHDYRSTWIHHTFATNNRTASIELEPLVKVLAILYTFSPFKKLEYTYYSSATPEELMKLVLEEVERQKENS